MSEKDPHGLSAKHRLFVEEYLVDLNGKQAAIRTGYSEKSAGVTACRLIADANVSRAIKDGMDRRAEKLGLDQCWVLQRLKLVSDQCVDAAPIFNAKGHVVEGVWQFDSQGANKATELVGKHLGMFREKVELTGKGGGPIQTESTVVFVELPSNGRDQNRSPGGAAD